MSMVPTLLRQFRRSLQMATKRLSQMLFVCYSLLNTQNVSINNSEGWLLVIRLIKKVKVGNKRLVIRLIIKVKVGNKRLVT